MSARHTVSRGVVWGAVWLAAVLGGGGRAAAALGETTPGYLAIQRAFLQEQFAEVATLTQVFLEQHPEAPETPRVRLWLALSLGRLQRANEALQQVDLVKRTLPPDDNLWPELLFWEGEISRKALQMVRAKVAYERLLDQYADSMWTTQGELGLGLVYFHQREFDLARDHFQRVAREQASAPVARAAEVLQSLCHLQLKEFEKAAALLAPLAQAAGPDRSLQTQVWLYYGESLTGLGRYDDAIAAYQQVLQAGLEEWARPALFGTGWAQFRAGRCDASLQTLDRYLALGAAPERRTETQFARASCLMQVGREREAAQAFGDIVRTQPGQPLALESGVALVDLERRHGELGEAKALVHLLLRWPLEETARAQLQLRLGFLALDAGNLAQAKTVFDLAQTSGEASVRQAAVTGLAELQAVSGHLPEARARYEEAIALAPDSDLATLAAYQVGRLDLQLGETDEAVKRLTELAAKPNAPIAEDARLALALAYLNRGDAALARAGLEALRREPARLVAVRALYYLGLVDLSEGQEAAAEGKCREVIARAPESDEAGEARVLLAELLGRRTSAAEAEAWLREAVRAPGLLARHRAKIAKRLGDYARAGGRYAEAMRWYDDAEARLPLLRGEVAYRLASCYEEGGDLDLAIQWYQAIPLAPWRVRGGLTAAKLLERQGRDAAAAALYERLTLEPSPESKVAQERLAALRAEMQQQKESR